MRLSLRRAVRPWAPAAAMMALLFLASSIPGSSVGLQSGYDLAAHALAYGLLGVLVLHALAGGRWRGITGRRAAGAVIIAGLYGLSDELHQRFVPGRTATLLDLAADVGGALCGVLLLWACGIVLSIRRQGPGERREFDG